MNLATFFGLQKTDITTIDEAIVACEDHLAAILDATADITFVLDEQQRYVAIWGRWLKENERSREEYIGKTPWEVFGGDTREFFERSDNRVLEGESVTYERWFELPWGRVYYQTCLSPLVGDDGSVIGIVGDARDLTHLKQTEERLHFLASHDPLTGLPNRRSFENAVERAVARAERGTPSTMLFIDVDNFKDCNDTLGHTFGDKVLIKIAEVLREQLRSPDMVARVGGDEFGALLEGAETAEADQVSDRMRKAVRALPQATEFALDLSIGLMSIGHDVTVEDAMAGADMAMYQAKHDENIHVVVFEGDKD